MAGHRIAYKKKTTGFGNVEEQRIIRAVEKIETRKHRRSALYANNRGIIEHTTSTNRIDQATETQQNQSNPQNVPTEDRRARLMKWKAEKELQKKLQRQLKPLAFRAGVYHHKLNSPIFLHQSLPITKPSKLAVATPRITRATAKRIAAKKNIVVKPKASITPSQLNNKVPKSSKTSAKITVLESSFAPENHKFKAPQGLPTLQLFGREALDEIKTEPGTVPVYFSPYVVSSRGKKALRKEHLHNMEARDQTSGETRNEEMDLEALRTSDNEEGSTPSYFRSITEKEVVRLTALCQQWMIVQSDVNIPEDAQLVINQAIGQTNLLINKKFEQFKKLIVDCETGSGPKLVTCQDLQGFWDMMYMQVINCDSRFEKLVKLQGNNWEEEQQEVVKKVIGKRPAATKKVLPAKSSSIRDMIRAARRKQIESSTTDNCLSVDNDEAPRESARLSVKFDGGFFMVESPKKTVTPRSIRKSTLLQHSQISGDAKLRRSALSAMRVSQLLKPLVIKPLEIESDPTIPYVNSKQTPGKSILKRMDIQEFDSGVKKSHNKVNFSQNQEKIIISNTSWLGDPNNISSDGEEKNTDAETELDVKKRLNFLTLDSSESDLDVCETDGQHSNSSKDSCDEEVGRLDGKVLESCKNDEENISERLEKTEIEKDKPSASSLIRNKSVDEIRTSSKTRKGVLNERNEETILQSSNIEANESEISCNKQNSAANEIQKENEKPNSSEITKRRRSSRKSVRFTSETCTACSEVKPVHPMTPRVKRRTSKLLETRKTGENSTEISTAETSPTPISEDLILWETPKDPPPRVRRSLRIKNSKQ